MRGKFHTDAEGRYLVRTVRPVHYPIPSDGPVGAMLRATGRHPWRPAHIHFVVSAEGYEAVTTHIFDSADEYLASDAVFAVKELADLRFHPARHGRRRRAKARRRATLLHDRIRFSAEAGFSRVTERTRRTAAARRHRRGLRVSAALWGCADRL